jgi:hypothetical protein
MNYNQNHKITQITSETLIVGVDMAKHKVTGFSFGIVIVISVLSLFNSNVRKEVLFDSLLNIMAISLLPVDESVTWKRFRNFSLPFLGIFSSINLVLSLPPLKSLMIVM